MSRTRKYQKAYDEIEVAISQGKSFNETLSDVCSRFQLTERTFANYWKDAQEEHMANQRAIKQELLNDTIEREKEANRAHLYDKGKRADELLSDIQGMRNEIIELRRVQIGGKKLGDHIIITTQTDVNAAKRTIARLQTSITQSLELLSKWYGYNEPENVNINAEMQVQNQVDISKMSDESIQELLLATGRIK